MFSKKVTTILSTVALGCAFTINAQAATFTYTGSVASATGAFAALTPIGSIIFGDIEIADAAVAAGSAGPADVTDIGVQLDPPGAASGFCFTLGAGTCPGGAAVPITSVDAGTALTFVGGASSGGTLDITAFSPTFGVSVPISFDITAGTFSASAAGLGTVDGFGTLSPTAVVPIPAAAWLFGSALLGLFGVRRRR